jgi:hypothetical protein
VLSRAIHNGLDAPQIRIPPPPPQVIGVADCVAKTRFLAADFANECHCFSDSFRKMMETILSEIGRARKQVNFIESRVSEKRRWGTRECKGESASLTPTVARDDDKNKTSATGGVAECAH